MTIFITLTLAKLQICYFLHINFDSIKTKSPVAKHICFNWDLKWMILGLVTNVDGKVFHGWTTRHEKKCFLMLDLTRGTMRRWGWPRDLLLGEKVKKSLASRQMSVNNFKAGDCLWWWTIRRIWISLGYDYRRADYGKFSANLRNVDWNEKFKIETVDGMWTEFVSVVNGMKEKYVPRFEGSI